MWLLDKMLRPLIREGRLVVTDHDGTVREYGDPAADPVRIRFTDKNGDVLLRALPEGEPHLVRAGGRGFTSATASLPAPAPIVASPKRR